MADNEHFTEGQEDRIITLHGPVIRGLRRFKYYVGAALVLLAVGNGYNTWVGQNQAKQSRERIVREAQTNCEERNQQAQKTAQREQAQKMLYLRLADIDERLSHTTTNKGIAKILTERTKLWRGLAKNIPDGVPPPPNCEFTT